jgi:hypothetical protein
MSERTLETLLRVPCDKDEYKTFPEFWEKYSDHRKCTRVPVDAAFSLGFSSCTLGWSFYAGYQAALESLLGRMYEFAPTAMCASEGKTGAHPAGLKTLLRKSNDQYILNGEKSFVTGLSWVKNLVVLCRIEDKTEALSRDEEIAIALVDVNARGVSLHSADQSLPFVPEIPHGKLTVRFRLRDLRSRSNCQILTSIF